MMKSSIITRWCGQPHSEGLFQIISLHPISFAWTSYMGAPCTLCMLSHFSHVWLFANPWTVAHQAPLWYSPGKNTAVGCHAFLQGTFLTQRSNPCLLTSPELAGGFFTTSATWGAPYHAPNALMSLLAGICLFKASIFLLISVTATLEGTWTPHQCRPNHWHRCWWHFGVGVGKLKEGWWEGYTYFNISLINPLVFEEASESDSGDPNLNYTI